MLTKIIGFSGATNGGKTTTCNHLSTKYPGSVVINQDYFFREEDDDHHEWIRLKSGRLHQNWENLASIDWQRFNDHLEQCVNKVGVNEGLLLIEGHLLFNYMEFKFNFDKKFFFTLDFKSCYKRRVSRLYQPADPAGYFEEFVWPMYLKNKVFVERNYDDVIFIDGTLDQKLMFDIVDQEINKLWSIS